jgi:hypothetical protein
MLSRHRLIYSSSSTMNFLWLSPTANRTSLCSRGMDTTLQETCHVTATVVLHHRESQKTRHVIPTHCCVTSLCMPYIATVHVQTQKKNTSTVVVWRVCWNVFTGLLPSNALSKSITILMLSMPVHLHCVTYWYYISDSVYLEICHLKAKSICIWEIVMYA